MSLRLGGCLFTAFAFSFFAVSPAIAKKNCMVMLDVRHSDATSEDANPPRFNSKKFDAADYSEKKFKSGPSGSRDYPKNSIVINKSVEVTELRLWKRSLELEADLGFWELLDESGSVIARSPTFFKVKNATESLLTLLEDIPSTQKSSVKIFHFSRTHLNKKINTFSNSDVSNSVIWRNQLNGNAGTMFSKLEFSVLYFSKSQRKKPRRKAFQLKGILDQ